VPKREVPATSFHLLQPQAPAFGRPPHKLLQLHMGRRTRILFCYSKELKQLMGPYLSSSTIRLISNPA